KAATAPTSPTRTGYSFTGWDKTFTSVKADMTVTAQYSAAKYTVTFVDWDGKTLKTQEVVYGKAATAPTSPTRTGYSFTGWDKTFTSVKADMTVTAQYSAAKYTVKFIDWDGKTLKTQEVEHGKAATAPTNPTRTGYKFVGWIGDYGNVVSDVTVTAKYEKKGTTTEDKDGVDLGLPSGTIWAKTNLGAKNEKDAGDFFAWGEKDNRESFSWENYGLGEGTWDKMTKYTGKDGKKKLAAEDDAAKVRTKNVWRMPTKAEMEELIEKCTWKLEGEGFRVTGPNGKSIYLPLGGLYMESREEEGTKGMYWGADIWEGSEWMSVSMYLSNERSKGQTHWTHRRMGLMIRPVK
ncbi:MAG: InlB B-repeat-containing protein, partial [Bacteroidales bacterium]|nr:InlB B-repeat-containing protein [Bacteroidales bacterium]